MVTNCRRTGGADKWKPTCRIEVTPKHGAPKFSSLFPGLRASSFQMSGREPEKSFPPTSSAGAGIDHKLWLVMSLKLILLSESCDHIFRGIIKWPIGGTLL